MGTLGKNPTLGGGGGVDLETMQSGGEFYLVGVTKYIWLPDDQ